MLSASNRASFFNHKTAAQHVTNQVKGDTYETNSLSQLPAAYTGIQQGVPDGTNPITNRSEFPGYFDTAYLERKPSGAKYVIRGQGRYDEYPDDGNIPTASRVEVLADVQSRRNKLASAAAIGTPAIHSGKYHLLEKSLELDTVAYQAQKQHAIDAGIMLNPFPNPSARTVFGANHEDGIMAGLPYF